MDGAGPSLDNPPGAVSQRHQEVELFRPQLAVAKQDTNGLLDSIANKSISHSIPENGPNCNNAAF